MLDKWVIVQFDARRRAKEVVHRRGCGGGWGGKPHFAIPDLNHEELRERVEGETTARTRRAAWIEKWEDKQKKRVFIPTAAFSALLRSSHAVHSLTAGSLECRHYKSMMTLLSNDDVENPKRRSFVPF